MHFCKGISADRILALVHISCLSSAPVIGRYLGRTYHIHTLRPHLRFSSRP